MEIQKKIEKINSWLRYHTEYEVIINLCDMYACISIRLKEAHKNEYSILFDIGDTLDKRLDSVLKWIEKKEGE